MNPVITIGIPTRNRQELLVEALRSAVEQKCSVQFEILIVDDFSENRTYLDHLRNRCTAQNVRFFLRDHCGGEGSARNTIIENMLGEYIVWLDDDDRLLPGALEAHLGRLSASSNIDIVYGNLLVTDADWNVIGQSNYQEIPANLTLHNLLFNDPFPNGGTLIRRTVFERIGQYDTSLVRGTDYHLWTRAAAAGCTFAHHPTQVYMYRSHDGNFQRGEDSPDFYPCMQKIIRNLVQNVSLERLFPMFPWLEERKRSESISLALVSLALMKCKAIEEANEVAEQSVRLCATPEGLLAYSLILGGQGQLKEAFRLMSKVALSSNKMIRDIAGLCGVTP